MAKSSSDLTGLLIVDKPGLPFDWQQQSAPTFPRPASGYDLPTSHDVVQRVRRRSGQRRIGHTGTLDPMASGVLVLCLGSATRLVEYYQGHDKRYLAEVTLGTATDTYDALGSRHGNPCASVPYRVNHRSSPGPFSRALSSSDRPFTPPLKQGGESLHRKARRGEEVTIKARRITVHDLSLVDWMEPNRLRLRITASAGTYVRSLAHDLGEALGTVGHLSALRREAAGPFTLDDAHPLDEIVAEDGEFTTRMMPLGWGLTLPIVQLDESSIRKLGFGQIIQMPADVAPWPVGTLAQGFNQQGAFMGIIRCLDRRLDLPFDDAGQDTAAHAGKTTGHWKAEKWFSNE